MQQEEGCAPTARKLKRMYEALRRRSSPTYKCGAKFDEHWFKLASLLKSENACPVTFIEAQFELWGGTPFPNQLCSHRALEIYRKYAGAGNTTGKQEFEHQAKSAGEYIRYYGKMYEKADDILGLAFLPLRPYTRVLLCSEDVLPQFLQKYGKDAAAEIRSNPSLEKHLKDNYVSRYKRLFPQGLPEVDGGELDPLPEPTRAPGVRESIPRRFRSRHT